MSRQLSLGFRYHGGPRRGAGRPPKDGVRAGVSHARRAVVAGRFPLHVTLRAVGGLKSFRDDDVFPVVERALADAVRGRAGATFRVVHFSVQSNHVHLLVEADDAGAFRAGVQGLAIRIARRVNRALSRCGKLWADRYHVHELRTPSEVRRTLVYVLQNARKHGVRVADGPGEERLLDPRSSACAFDGWRDADTRGTRSFLPWLFPADTWLATAGWRRFGLISLDERPRPPPNTRARRPARRHAPDSAPDPAPP